MSENKRIRLRDIFAMEQLSPIELIKQLQKDGLIANSMSCSKCNKDMSLSSRPDTTDKFGWRCSKCGSRKSVRTGSWFSESHLSMIKILQLTYMWVLEYSNKDVVHELEIGKKPVVDWFNFSREVCVEILVSSEKEKIGGPGIIVEIYESKFGKRKFHRGKYVEGQWVFGGIERGTGKSFLEVIENRVSKTLTMCIQNNIKDGTIIISDCWKACDVLDKMDYEHLTMNHSVNFKNPATGAHTNTIEGTYLAAFMYRRLRKDAFDPYKQFLLDIAKIYDLTKLSSTQ